MLSLRHATAVTPNDSTAVKFKALYIGNTGHVSVRTLGGETATFNSVPTGTTLWISVDRVRATGTTAADIIGLN